MKNPIFIFLGIILSGSLTFGQGTVSVSGKIDNPAGKSVSVYYYPNLLVERPVSHKATLDEEGKFQISFPLEQATSASFSHGREQTAMFIHPGDQIVLSLNPEQFDETIKYKGEGPGVDASNFLAKFFLKFEDEGVADDSKVLIKEGLELEYAAWVNRVYNNQRNFLNEYAKSHKLSEDFLSFVSSRILYTRGTRLMQFPAYHAYLAQKDVSEVKLSKGYYEFLSEVRPMNAHAVNVPEYVSFVQNYISWSVDNLLKEEGVELDPEARFSREYKFVSTTLQDEPMLLIQASMLKDFLQSGNPMMVESIYAEFVAADKKGDYAKILQPIYDQAMLLAPGKPAPEFTLVDINGQQVSLSDFKGKVVYLDFWASWCGPCRAEMPASRRLFQANKGKDVVFLYISIDEDEAAWRKAVADEQLQGVLLYSQGGNSEVANMYGVKFIPNYFLINRDGTIANSNPSRPSAPGIQAEIDAALGVPFDQDR
ncbi:MAG: TlpA disulfide reductase family protein [Bacteroidia bacterium]